MTQNYPRFQSRREILLAVSATLLASTGCNRDGSESSGALKLNPKPFKMGERATVGLITYNVLEAEYKTQLSIGSTPRMPEKRFLVVRLAITNGSAKEVELPMYSLVDDAGEAIVEATDGSGLTGWFGLIRKIGPTMTEEGRILFDVQPRNYKLQVSDGGETSNELLAHIEIPMQFDTAEPIQGAATPKQ